METIPQLQHTIPKRVNRCNVSVTEFLAPFITDIGHLRKCPRNKGLTGMRVKQSKLAWLLLCPLDKEIAPAGVTRL
jgi:hypothetical protein